MTESAFWSVGRLAGASLMLSFMAVVSGGTLYISRSAMAAELVGTARFQWERGFIIGAVVLTGFGLFLLQQHLRHSDGRILTLGGALLYLLGAALILMAEGTHLVQGRLPYAPVVAYVLLALVAQALMGAALTQSALLPASVGWAVMLWNLAWLIILPLTTPDDVYFPVLHHIAPVVISVPLLLEG